MLLESEVLVVEENLSGDHIYELKAACSLSMLEDRFEMGVYRICK